MTDDKLTLCLTREEIRLLINSAYGTHERIFSSRGIDSSPIQDLMYRLADEDSDVYVQDE